MLTGTPTDVDPGTPASFEPQSDGLKLEETPECQQVLSLSRVQPPEEKRWNANKF